MSLVICQGGLVALLNTKVPYLAGVMIGLYQTPITPNVSDNIGTYTGLGVEATFTGYMRQPVVIPGPPFYAGGGNAELDMNLVFFTPTGVGVPNTIYGYFVVDGAGALVLAERNPAAPITVGANLLPYVVQPVLLEQSIP